MNAEGEKLFILQNDAPFLLALSSGPIPEAAAPFLINYYNVYILQAKQKALQYIYLLAAVKCL